MKPFLLLATRQEDQAADEEYDAFLRFTGLSPQRLHRVRLEAGPMPAVDLEDYAGVFLGGGPFNASDPEDRKSSVQHRVEQEIRTLLDALVARDFPFFGACYGIGTLGVHQGGSVDTTYAEAIGTTRVALTEAGVADPLLGGLPGAFEAYVGHKEACRDVPPGAVLLATAAGCPVQMFRVRTNLYATQFHPELDRPGLITRIRVYRDAGYFDPVHMEALIERIQGTTVTEPPQLLRRFVELYG